jgi:thiamine biosynthesis lipoprotein
MNNVFIKKYLFNLILKKAPLIILALFLSGCSQTDYVTQSKLLMGTTVSITVEAPRVNLADEAIAAAFFEIERIENMMSFFKDSSLLNELNRQALKKPFKIPDELFSLIETSQEFSKLTDGAFDITATSLGEADGYKNIVLDKKNKTVYYKDKKVKIDLGAAAKGYAVDKAVVVLKSYGLNDILVNAGGDIYASGHYSNRKWAIGIRNPLKIDEIEGKIYLSNRAVATSGNYLRVHIFKTIDKEMKSDVISATVIASKCLEADILATAVFVAPDTVLRVAEELENIDILLIKDVNGKLKEYKTSGFMKYQTQ